MKTGRLSLSLVAGITGLVAVLTLTGCSSDFGAVSNTPSATEMHIQGVVHGGQQSLNGAHVYMYAASTGGYGGAGIAASTTNASTSLLTASSGVTTSDGTNYYVTTNQAGNFNIDGAFACTPGTQVYLYSTGGDPQLNGYGTTSGSNSAAGMLAVVGNCASATPSAAFPNVTFVTINEVSTIAAVYALAGFATDPTHIGAPSAVSGHSLSATGIANAFNGALNIASQTTGSPLTSTSAGNGTVPRTLINSLADILSACVNSVGPSSSGCSTLFGDTKNSAGTAPTDTATAAINIAQNPAQNVTPLLNTIPSAPPFSPTISSANDFTLGILYTGGGINNGIGIAVDSLGNVWTTSTGNNTVNELSPLGAALSPSTGYTGGGIGSTPYYLAIDASNNVWITSYSGNRIAEISSTGTAISPAAGYTGNGLNNPYGIGIDASGNVWAVNYTGKSVSKFSSSGTAISSYTASSLGSARGLAIDGSGNVWMSDYNGGTGNNLAKFSNTGTNLSGIQGFNGGGLISPASQSLAIDNSGYVWVADLTGGSSGLMSVFSSTGTPSSTYPSGFGGGGINSPVGVAIDGAGTVWVTDNVTSGAISGFPSTSGTPGKPLSSTGYTAGGQLNKPYLLAIDGSGNLWTTTANGVVEILGVAAPVATPTVANLLSPYGSPASKP